MKPAAYCPLPFSPYFSCVSRRPYFTMFPHSVPRHLVHESIASPFPFNPLLLPTIWPPCVCATILPTPVHRCDQQCTHLPRSSFHLMHRLHAARTHRGTGAREDRVATHKTDGRRIKSTADRPFPVRLI